MAELPAQDIQPGEDHSMSALLKQGQGIKDSVLELHIAGDAESKAERLATVHDLSLAKPARSTLDLGSSCVIGKELAEGEAQRDREKRVG